jgi:hypothetical protein
MGQVDYVSTYIMKLKKEERLPWGFSGDFRRDMRVTGTLWADNPTRIYCRTFAYADGLGLSFWQRGTEMFMELNYKPDLPYLQPLRS